MYYADAGSLRNGELGGYGRVRIFRYDLDEGLHLLFGDFQDGPGAVVHDETPFHLAGIDQVQSPLLLRPKEHEGVVGRWNEVPDPQGSEPLGNLLPLPPSCDDDKPTDMGGGFHTVQR